ncbi:MAG: hypothetical protein WCP43_02370 [Dehalococcoidia bacterium]
MIQSFQCPICGNLNALGEPECSECGQGFAYNCPVCGSQLNNRYPTCPNCRTVFNWGTPARSAAASAGPITPQEAYEEQQAAPVMPPAHSTAGGAADYTARPMFWVTLMVVCAVIIALLLIADVIINK